MTMSINHHCDEVPRSDGMKHVNTQSVTLTWPSQFVLHCLYREHLTTSTTMLLSEAISGLYLCALHQYKREINIVLLNSGHTKAIC